MTSVTYVDSSALVKLVVEEPESDALRAFLGDDPSMVSCLLARTEVLRAIRSSGSRAVERARALLDQVTMIAIDQALVDTAADARPESLRSLDAIHVAAAAAVGDDISALVTYDRRMADAARGSGLEVAAPGALSGGDDEH